jgi:Cu/Ag efflux protein CusF
MKERIVAVLGALSLLVATGCATPQDKPPAKQTAPAAQQPAPDLSVREKITATATVQAINLETRQVTLKDKNGKLHTITVSEEARNLPQVKVGDQVILTYYEALAIMLQKNMTGGITEKRATVSVDRAELGQKPAGTVRQNVDIIANVIALDKKTRKVTLKGPQQAITLKVPAEIDISGLKVGDQVRAEYVQELAIAVEPAPVKPVKPGPGFKNKRS